MPLDDTNKGGGGGDGGGHIVGANAIVWVDLAVEGSAKIHAFAKTDEKIAARVVEPLTLKVTFPQNETGADMFALRGCVDGLVSYFMTHNRKLACIFRFDNDVTDDGQIQAITRWMVNGIEGNLSMICYTGKWDLIDALIKESSFGDVYHLEEK